MHVWQMFARADDNQHVCTALCGDMTKPPILLDLSQIRRPDTETENCPHKKGDIELFTENKIILIRVYHAARSYKKCLQQRTRKLQLWWHHPFNATFALMAVVQHSRLPYLYCWTSTRTKKHFRCLFLVRLISTTLSTPERQEVAFVFTGSHEAN